MRKYSKLSTAPTSFQNGQIIRFIMVIGIVILTLFIYAFYNSNPTLLSHSSISSPSSSAVFIPPAVSESLVSVDNSNLKFKTVDRNNVNSQHILDSSKTVEDIVNIKTGISVISNTSTQSQQLLQDANEFLLQQNNVNMLDEDISASKYNVKLAEKNYLSDGNADLNNNSYAGHESEVKSANNSSALDVLQPSNKKNQRLMTTTTKSIDSSNIQKIQRNVMSDTITKTVKTRISKGVITKDIYEKGHLPFNKQLLCPDSNFNGLDPIITPQIKLFIFITSAPTHFDARLAIRQTWGNYANRRDISIAFFLGQSGVDQTENKLDSENDLYGDLIRGNFFDSYNNLTLKTISMLEWVDKNCNSPLPKFILKTDDDMFINIPKLLDFVDKHEADKLTIYGRLAKKWKPIRNKNSKYYVAPNQFAASVFPHFTTGPAYLLTSDVVHSLYEKCLEVTYLKLEDVFTTGIVSQKLNIKRVHVNEFLNRRIPFNPCNIRKAISVHMIKPTEQIDLWAKFLNQIKCK